MTHMNPQRATWETRSEDDAQTEVRAAIDTLTSTVETRLAAIGTEVAEVRARQDRVETIARRPGAATEQRQENDIEVRAFSTYLRSGREALGADEIRSLHISDGTAGGFLAPSQFSAELLKNVVNVSPIRALATVTAITGSELILPKMTGTSTAQWVSETGTRPNSEPTFGQVSIVPAEAAVYIDISRRLLEDAGVNVEAEVSAMLATDFSRLEGAAFVAGDGVGKPRGIVVHPDLPVLVNGHATTLNPDKLIALMYAVKPAHRSRGAWMMNGASIAAVRSLKSSTSGEYMFKESLADGVPATLLGRPVYEVADLDDVASDKLPILFGDWATGYRVVDKVGLSILSDPYSQATNGLVRLHARRRVGGEFVMPEAVMALKMATS